MYTYDTCAYKLYIDVYVYVLLLTLRDEQLTSLAFI